MDQKLVPVSFTVHLPAVIIKRKKWYVANCPVLDVASQGDTEDEARKNLIEAIMLFLGTCYEMGTLGAVLKDCGFVPDYSLSDINADQAGYIDVPLPFMVDMGTAQRCPV